MQIQGPIPLPIQVKLSSHPKELYITKHDRMDNIAQDSFIQGLPHLYTKL